MTSSKKEETLTPSWTSEIYQQFKKRTTTSKAFDTKWDEVPPAVTDRLTYDKIQSVYKMQVEKSEDFEHCVASLRSKEDI